MLLRTFLLLSLVAVGCGDGNPIVENDAGASPDGGDASTPPDGSADAAPPDAGGPTRCDLEGAGQSFYYVVDVLDIAGPQSDAPDVVPGFDLDGIVSDGFDEEGCFQPDFSSGPPENVPGIDSQVGKLLLMLGFNDDISQDFPQIIQSGELIILVAVHGVDDLVTDECVHVELMAGSLVDTSETPRVTAEGRFEPDQSFRTVPPPRLADAETSALLEDAFIAAGRVVARGGVVFDVGMPLDGSSSFLVRERDLQIAFDITAAGLGRGIIGARSDVDETVAINDAAFENLEITALQLRAILRSGADLDRTAQGCQSISISHIFQATPAVPAP